MHKSKTKKRFIKRNKHKKINKHLSRHKYSYKKKSFHKIKGGMFRPHEPVKMKQKLKPIVSRYWLDSVCDETVNVVANGNIIFEDLIRFLNSDGDFYFQHIDPKEYEKFTPEEIKKFTDFYSNEENKKWLGCQIFLMLTVKDISQSKCDLPRGYVTRDDGNYFFKWLTHRLKEGDPQLFTEDAPNP